ncbi:MAG: putative heme-binding protein, partial [Chthoniobacter sp.]|nr:putative heme-binding protein [Chthoniobacter sp.]
MRCPYLCGKFQENGFRVGALLSEERYARKCNFLTEPVTDSVGRRRILPVPLMKIFCYLLLTLLIPGLVCAQVPAPPYLPDSRAAAAKPDGLFAPENLVAWCIVPFDTKKRGPEERAKMLDRLGIKRLAYDYRAEHIPTFDAEVETMKKHGIEFTAWWFPGALNDEAKNILAVIQRHKITPQLWVTGGGGVMKNDAEQAAQVEREAARIQPIAEAAQPLGCKVALYNHGGWFGEPENQIAIIERLARDGVRNVGIVYNFHHGHAHIARFPELWKKMQPHLLAVNLNGMELGADGRGRKIINLSEGDQEIAMLRAIRDSGWKGPVGILNHRDHLDA